jgi:3-dehydroquinate dehydratase/shikimate dehydrogenase
MICISIAQESRRMALVDMLNAARQCDLLEVRLDRFAKAADVGELLAAKPKPVILGCRRVQDGGAWEGSEDERLALLRQCIISKADYVEIELDAADQIRPYGPTKRVISYTNLSATPANLGEIYAQALTKKPDVIKFTTSAETPEEAWPMLQILAKPAVPTVVVGLGKPGVMLGVLGKKMDAPWTYAALERGLEAYPGQPTVSDLNGVYHYPAINRSTRLVGVTGFGERERATVAALNAAFAHLEMPARCLPLGVGSMRLFRKIIEAVKLAAAVIDPEHRRAVLEIATELDPSAAQARSADLVLRKDERWHGYDTSVGAAADALEATLKAADPGKGLNGRMVVIVGTDETAVALARELQQRGGALIIAGPDRAVAQAIAKGLECRAIQFEALYSTMHDVLVVCDEDRERVAAHGRKLAVHPGYLRPGMTVMQLTPGLHKSTLLRAAEARGCAIVTPYQVWLEQVGRQARRLTGKEVARQLLADAAPWLLEEE